MTVLAAYDFGEHVELATFIGDAPVFAVADGTVRFPTLSDRVEDTADGLLCAATALDRSSIVTGGESGQIFRVTIDAITPVCRPEASWIDVIACGPQGAIAFASGRAAWVHNGDELKRFDHARAVEGLAFAPKGLRLACARYNGVSLHWAAAVGDPVDLHWDGAHTGVSFSPDGRYIITTMVENALHGWRLDKRKKSKESAHMRMSGYPAKPKSLSWSHKGHWLASSGAPAAICWPFSGREGPTGKSPRELGTRGDSMVTQVACHPQADVVAAGYADGMVMAIRIEDAAEVLLRRPGSGAVSSLIWNSSGDQLVFGTEEGEAGLVTING